MSSNRNRLAKLWRGVRDSRTSENGSVGGGNSSTATRIVHCNERSRNELYRYPKNRTSTTKYTWYSFLPMSLFLQYRRAAYWYFTAIAGLSLTSFSPHAPTSIVLPLVFVLGLGIGREFWEDLRRSRGDKVVNSSPVQVLFHGERIETLRWQDLQVGDLVRVADGEYFPADLLLLSSSGADGVCYVETKNLDGETNLKVRRALESTWNEQYSESTLGSFRGDVRCETPNASLYTFTGRLEMQDGHSFPAGPTQMLLRDSSLQNTGHIWGAVIYAGPDTKVMQNSTAPPSKRSRIDRSLDKVIYIMFAILLCMSVLSGAVFGYRTSHEGPGHWYLDPYDDDPYYNPNKSAFAGFGIFINGLILYGYLVPIGLYVSLEFVRVFQGISMTMDPEMFEPSIRAGAKVRTTGLNEELGQVDTILSDKTGTLTCNQMDFFRCSIAGVSYGKGTTEVEKAARLLGVGLKAGGQYDLSGLKPGEEKDDAQGNRSKVKGFNFSDSRLLDGNWSKEANPDVVQLFFRILALCHTAIPEGNVEAPQSMEYRAESPDEAALVVAAKQFGFCFYKRTPSALCIRESVGRQGEHSDRTYELLNVLEFSSARKRMSVIVRYPDGRLMLLSKGADSVMIERADPKDKRFSKSTMHQLKQYAEVGLRTLVVAYRELHEDELQRWQIKYAKASGIIGHEREERIEQVVDEIERNLRIVGGTGVEDKLQVGVPETIDKLAQAGINIWVLTGDKVETAINIGYASSLLRKGMHKVIISLEGSEAREVEERAEKQGLSREDVNRELTSIVALQLSDGSREIERLRDEADHMQHPAEMDRKSFSFESVSANFRASLRGRSRRSLSHKELGQEQELQEYTSLKGHEIVEEEFPLASSQELKIHRPDDFGSHNLAIKSLSLHPVEHQIAADGEISFALVIDGYSLAFVLADDKLQEEFIQVCKECASVLCCRVSPRQKAQVTKLVKKGMGENKLCLAIGDGANDVGMIQAANVGVGMIGVEGAQAVMAADYAIAQFRFLERLLLVHGHWCYRRISLMILYYYYKGCLIAWVAFCGNAYAFFSGQPLYNDWYASFYHTLFTSLPVCVVGILDQDVSAKECLKYPQVYKAGHRKEFFNRKLITVWLLNSVYSGVLIFFFPLALYWVASFRANGMTASLPEFGAMLFTGLVLVPNVQLLLAINYFTWIHHIAIWGSIVLWYLFLLIYGALPIFGSQFGPYPTSAYKVLIESLGPSPSYWLLQLLMVCVALLPSYLVRSFKSTFYPSDYQIVSEITAREGREARQQQFMSREGV
ncbi:unnamed protein product [Calypogeia fissa]